MVKNILTSVAHTMTTILYILVALAKLLTRYLGFEAWIKCFGWVTTFCRHAIKFWSSSKQLWHLHSQFRECEDCLKKIAKAIEKKTVKKNWALAHRTQWHIGIQPCSLRTEISPLSLNILMMLCTVDDEICKAFAHLTLRNVVFKDWRASAFSLIFCFFSPLLPPCQLLFRPFFEASNLKWAHLVDKSVKFLCLNCYVTYVLLWIKYWLVWFESLLVFMLFKFKKRPNISGFWVVHNQLLMSCCSKCII